MLSPINCAHCHRKVNIKIYKAHKRLYYDDTTDDWQTEQDEKDTPDTSSDESDASLEDFIATVQASNQNEYPDEFSDSQFDRELPYTTQIPISVAVDMESAMPEVAYPIDTLESTGKYWVSNYISAAC